MAAHLDRLSNLNYLKYTNKTYYEGAFDLPNVSCRCLNPHIEYLAIAGESRDYCDTDAICFYTWDRKFDGRDGLFNAIYYDDRRWLRKFATKYSNVKYFIAPDYSIYGDIPLIENVYRLYKARIVTCYIIDALDKFVIPNISFVDERTKEFALTGIDRGTTVCISTKGLMNGKNNLELLDYIVGETLRILRPSCVLLYTVTANEEKLKPLCNRIRATGANLLIPDNLLLLRNRRSERHG